MRPCLKNWKRNGIGLLLEEAGVSLILIFGVLFFLIIFMVIAIDVAYLYAVRGQLYNAADAAALAGVAELQGNGVAQPDARQEAWKFACENSAASSQVMLVTATATDPDTADCASPPAAEDLNIANTDGGDYDDIVVGNWDGTDFDPTDTPVNAVQVVARRTVSAPLGNFGLFFAKVLGKHTMEVGATAIAAKEGLPFIPLPLCINTVTPLATTPIDFSSPSCPGQKFLFNPPGTAQACGTSWVNYESTTSQPNPPVVRAYLENPYPIYDICDLCFRSKQGVSSVSDLEDAFDRYKQAETDMDGNPILRDGIDPLIAWKVLVPVFDNVTDCYGVPFGPNSCPGDQPTHYKVKAVAELLVTKVDAPGPDNCPHCGSNNTVGISFVGAKPLDPPVQNQMVARYFSCDNPDDMKQLMDLAGGQRLVY
ncbi:MAG: pilus assembly protein TadG-related protein [Thermodesulfobacteriota bacterium]